MSKEIYKLTGLRELERSLGELPKATRRQVALRTLKEGGEPIAKAARALVRVDKGDLKESIDVSTKLARSQQADKGAVAPVEMHVGPGQHPQGITEEFGTWFEPGHPFLRPAWEAERLHTLDIIGTLLGIEIEKAAARRAAKG
ncbi:HK97 gp10 family phage protein [Sphingobium phenoxybenzoativorans]|uniref:HK97 gp10 family phage protein n=1 Tax=Sphingobium phenoxybenzoativorans TaxID=1592790 RepID=A0A975Q3N3_9SPHN|nr:HK97-gp10 family putative phage morphogenesis protein [Sphingobium phenoxybenzoativorans]QUT07916.1 HK97 gp10 family phage protein [Sphingobium phenoxybenzoativorans]